MADLPRLPGIPTVTPVKDPTIAAILRPMKESIEILGSALSGDAFANGQSVTSIPGAGGIASSTAVYDPNTDYTPPSTPTGFTVSGAFATVILAWNKATYINHSHTEIWRATSNALGSASLIGFCPGTVYTDTVTTSSTYYYWIRHVSQANVAGAYNASSGTVGTTADDPVYVMGVLSDAYGSTSQAPFFQIDTATTINGVLIAPGTYMKSAFIADATITSAKIKDAAIDNAKIDSLSAAKITSGYISSALIEAGSISADKIGAGRIAATDVITIGGTGSGAPLVLSASGEVISNGSAGDKARLWSGNVEIYKQVPSVGQVIYKALSRAEFGQATNNTAVTIPGYFKTQPKVIVSPADLKLYDSAYASQSQSIQCQAQNLVESSSGSMVWTFTPVATLSLAANTGNTVLNETSGSDPDSWYSSNYITPANCTSITPSVALASSRGNGASQYYNRTVRWRFEYYNSGAWQVGSWNTTNLAASTTASTTGTATLTFPSAGSWTFRVYCEAYDTDGGVFGAVDYDYWSGTATNTGTVSLDFWQQYTDTTVNMALSGGSVPAGYSVTSVSYSVNWTAGGASGIWYDLYVGGSRVFYTAVNGIGGSGTRTWTTSSYSSNIPMRVYVASGTYYGSGIYATASISNGSATISARKPKVNSTTANNVYTLNSYAFTLSSSQVLATGSLNWIALGD